MSDGALQQLRDFEIITKLGGGGMAEVYLARTRSDAGFEKLVAIKHVQPGMAGNERFIKMLLDEARIAASLNHSNIAQVFDLRRAADTYFMIMEYVHGITLQQIRGHFAAKHEPPPGSMTAYILAHLCAALEYAHTRTDPQGRSQGIIHRDVSPDNVMVSFEGEVKLIDLGIVKAKQRLNETRGVLIKGKPSYMSPEQALGSTVDHRTDIYAVGVVLYELLTLKNPRLAVSLPHQGPNLPSGEFSLPSEITSDVDPKLEQICLKALAIEPNNRYQSAGALERALQDWLTEQPFSRSDLASWLQQNMEPVRARRERKIHGIPNEASSGGTHKPSTAIVAPPQGYAQVVKLGAAAPEPVITEASLEGSKSMIYGPAVGGEEERTSEFRLPPGAQPGWQGETEAKTQLIASKGRVDSSDTVVDEDAEGLTAVDTYQRATTGNSSSPGVNPAATTVLLGARTKEESQLHVQRRPSRLWLLGAGLVTLGVAIVVFMLIQDPGLPDEKRPTPIDEGPAPIAEPATVAPPDSGTDKDTAVSPITRVHSKKRDPQAPRSVKVRSEHSVGKSPVRKRPVRKRPVKRRPSKRPSKRHVKRAPTKKAPLNKAPPKKAPPKKAPAKKRTGDQLPFEDL